MTILAIIVVIVIAVILCACLLGLFALGKRRDEAGREWADAQKAKRAKMCSSCIHFNRVNWCLECSRFYENGTAYSDQYQAENMQFISSRCGHV